MSRWLTTAGTRSIHGGMAGLGAWWDPSSWWGNDVAPTESNPYYDDLDMEINVVPTESNPYYDDLDMEIDVARLTKEGASWGFDLGTVDKAVGAFKSLVGSGVSVAKALQGARKEFEGGVAQRRSTGASLMSYAPLLVIGGLGYVAFTTMKSGRSRRRR